MRKPELAAAIAEQADMSKTAAADVLNVVLDEITMGLVNGDRVNLPGLGSFSPSQRAARTGKNPQTGEPIQIAASTSVRFSAAKALKDAVKG